MEGGREGAEESKLPEIKKVKKMRIKVRILNPLEKKNQPDLRMKVVIK